MRAILHSILFVRALGVAQPRVQSADLGVGEDQCSYAAIDDRHIAYRIDRAVELAQKALCGPFQVVEVEIEFGALDSAAVRRRKQLSAAEDCDRQRQKQNWHRGQRASSVGGGGPMLKQVSNWASWLTESLASVGKASGFEAARHSPSSFASFADTLSQEDDSLLTKDVAKIWERWKFRIYVVDEQTYWQSKKPRLAELLGFIVDCAGATCDDLPPLVTADTITYPFRTHVREAHAMMSSSSRVGVRNTVGAGRRRSGTCPIEIATRSADNWQPQQQQQHSRAQTIEHFETDFGDGVRVAGGGVGSAGVGSGWWGSMRFSPGSGTWEDGMGLLKDLVKHAPNLSSSPPF